MIYDSAGNCFVKAMGFHPRRLVSITPETSHVFQPADCVSTQPVAVEGHKDAFEEVEGE